jgi:hypothetical protein
MQDDLILKFRGRQIAKRRKVQHKTNKLPDERNQKIGLDYENQNNPLNQQ